MAFVEAGGARLRCRTWGRPEAPRILVVHGFGQTCDFLAGLAEALVARADVSVLAPDLRGHGGSDDLGPGPADASYVADLRVLGAGAAVWFGNSLGARAVALAAAGLPAPPRLVLGECIVGLEQTWHFLLAGARRQATPPAFADREAARRFGRDVRRLRGAALELWLVHGLDGELRDLTRPSILEPGRWPDGDAAIRARLAAIAGPVELLYGDAGSALSPARQREVASAFGAARVGHLAGAGHDLFLDAPDALAAALLL